ncbi:MAG: hypothetical protein M3069_29330 [Chloroflexota bacterium]|nr:hypothetical protein [Chloroflexota bacterium]
MATSDQPTVIHIDVEPRPVNLTFDHILTPLTRSADNHLAGGTLTPEVAALIQRMRDLTAQLNDVVSQINQLAPGLLAATPSP